MDRIAQAAIEILVKADAKSLPVDVLAVAREIGCIVQPYGEAEQLLAASNKSRENLPDGMALQQEDDYYILYDDNLMPEKRSWIIAHELGHIALHMDKSSPYLTGAPEGTRQEKEAETFARHLLAPLPALHTCRIKTPGEISALVGLSEDVCRKVCFELKRYEEEKQQQEARRQAEDNYNRFRIHRFLRAHRTAIVMTSLVTTFAVILAMICVGYSTSLRQLRAQLDNQSQATTTTPVVQPDPSAGGVADVTGPAEDPATDAPVEATTTTGEDRIVYITREGDRYHNAGCRYVAGREDTITMTEAEAQRAGYEACAFCGG